MDIKQQQTEIINKLVTIRKKKKMTQDDIVKISGLTQQSISRMENELYSPNIRTLLRYANSIGVKLDVFE